MMEEPEPVPRTLSPGSSGRRRSSDSTSPEFEFWMVSNPSFPQPNLLSADELFSDGVLLPLHLLQPSAEPPSTPQEQEQEQEQEQDPTHEESVSEDHLLELENSTNESADVSATTCTTLTSSKRWIDIFKKTDKKTLSSQSDDHCTKEKKREKKSGGGVGVGATAAELNINIWPFSRSRSAGNGATRPRAAAPARKVSSAPCSRSNSAGESKSRKWPSSPSRPAGVHLGRSSPVWQVRRGGGRSSEGVVKSVAEKNVKKDGNDGRRKVPASAAARGGGAKGRVLSLNVPMCIGYRHHLSCRSDENSAISIAAAAAVGGGDGLSGGGVAGEGVRRSNLLNIRSLFTRKVY